MIYMFMYYLKTNPNGFHTFYMKAFDVHVVMFNYRALFHCTFSKIALIVHFWFQKYEKTHE